MITLDGTRGTSGSSRNGHAGPAGPFGQSQYPGSQFAGFGAYGPAPGKGRGLVRWLRESMGGWLGPKRAHGSQAARELTREKAASGPRLVTLPWFLPYFDDVTGETATARLYYRKMWADPVVKAAILAKIFSVASLTLKIHPADEHNSHDVKVAQFVEWTLTKRCRGSVPNLVWSILSGGLTDGYSVCEKSWKVQEKGKYAGKYILVNLKPKLVGDDLVLQTDEFRNVVGVMGLRYNAGEEFSVDDFVIFRHLPLYDYPTGMSDFRAIYSKYWLLDTAWKLRSILLEKRALPLLVGHYQDPTTQSALEHALGLAKSQNWLSAPESARIEALNLAGSAEDVFSSAIRDLKEEIFLGIQGATLQALLGGPQQQRGSSNVHQDTSELFAWYLSGCILSLLNDEDDGLIKDIVDLNHVVSEYPYATLSAVDVNELAQELQIDDRLHGWGLPLSKDEIYKRYGRTPPQDRDDTIPGAPQGPGGSGGGGPGAGGLAGLLGAGGGSQAPETETAGAEPSRIEQEQPPDQEEPQEAFGMAEDFEEFDELPQRREGEVWEGRSGRWFTKHGGRVVPAKNPQAAEKPKKEKATRQQAKPKKASRFVKEKASRGQMVEARRVGTGEESRVLLADGTPAPDHIKPGMIPSNWTGVQISMNPHADVLVTARDQKGWVKTVYVDNFHTRTAAVKFARTREIMQQFPAIMQEIKRDRASPAKRDAADCAWLMAVQATRPGSKEDTGADVKAYGATTLEGRHVVQAKDGVRLQFVGKEGVAHDHLVRNRELAAMLLERKKKVGDNGQLFNVNNKKVRAYVGTLDGGGFLSKDLRTNQANQIAMREIRRTRAPKTRREYQRAVKAVAERVSHVLGNQPEQALESYISPELFAVWRAGIDEKKKG